MKRKFKSPQHKRMVLEHEAFLRSITGKKRPRLKGVQVASEKVDASHRKRYPSLDDRGSSDATASQERIYLESDTHTVAVGYNKGGYQVVAKEDLPTAGKKV